MLIIRVVCFMFCEILLILLITSLSSSFMQLYTCTWFLMSGSSFASVDSVSSLESLLYFSPFLSRYPRILPWIYVFRRVRLDLCLVRSLNWSVCSSGIYTSGR
jgi:hypothetical protein